MTKLSVLSLLLCMSFLPGIFAQGNLTVNASYDTTLWYQNNHVFENIDAMKIPSGILLDYGIQFTDLSRFDGSSINDSNVVSFGTLEQINATLYTGTIRPVQNKPMHPDSLYANLRRNTQVNHLKLSGLLYT